MVAKIHRKHFPEIGEGVIYIPSGMPFEVDDPPEYDAGSYVRLGNKEFIYAIAGGDLTTDRGAMNSYVQKVVRAHVAKEYAAGVLVIGITPDSDSGLAWSEGVEEDELKGGQFITYPSTEWAAYVRGIISNSSIPAGSGTIYLTLDSPTPVKTPIDKWSECLRNPYGAVKANQGDYAMTMGIPTVVASEGQGLWLQVGGPCWVAPSLLVGAAAKDVEVVFVGNGTLALRGATTDRDCQHAGVCIALAAGEQGSMMIMLQVAH